MDIIKQIENRIIDQYGRDVLTIIQSEKQLKKAIEQAISDINWDERGKKRQLITNPSAFNGAYYQSITVDVAKVQEQIKTELVKQLYTRNLITESEYKKVCPTQ